MELGWSAYSFGCTIENNNRNMVVLILNLPYTIIVAKDINEGIII